MTARLPIPGGDDNTWGDILNNYLEVSLNSDGTLKSSAVSTSGTEQTANKDVANGYAGLDSSTKVPLSLLPSALPPDGPASGDLSGSYPNPSVAQINGITLPGSGPSNGQVLTATGTSSTAWSTPASGSQPLAATAVKTSAYSSVAGDFVPVDASGSSVTVTLPTAPADNTRIGIKMINVSGNNTVTIDRGGSSDVFNKAGGATSLTLALLNQGVLLQYDSSSGIWYVQSDDLPLSQISQTSANYIIYKSGSNYYAKNGTTGISDYGGSDVGAVLQSAITALVTSNGNAVGEIVFAPGTYTYSSTVPAIPPVPPGNAPTEGWLRIRGVGGVTIQLASGAYRFLDFKRNADYDSFVQTEVSDFVIDGMMLTPASSNHVVIGTAINGFGTSGAQRVNMADIAVKRVTVVNCPTDPSGSVARLGIALSSYHPSNNEATQTSIQRVVIEDFTMLNNGMCGIDITANGGGTAHYNILIDNIVLNRCYISQFLSTISSTANYGDSTVALVNTSGFPTSGKINLGEQVSGSNVASQVAVAYTGISGNSLQGCSWSGGTGAGSFDVGNPAGFQASSNIQIGSGCIGGRYTVRDCYCGNSGDNNLEINNSTYALIQNVVCENGTVYGFYANNYNNPLYPLAQNVNYDNCHYRQTYGYNSARGFGLGDNTDVAISFESVSYSNCSTYHSSDPNGFYTGMGLICQATINKLTISGFYAYANFSSSAISQTYTQASLIYLNLLSTSSTQPRCNLVMNNIDLETEGTINTSGAPPNINFAMAVINGSDVEMSIDTIRLNWNCNYGATRPIPLILLGGQSFQGKINGYIRRPIVEAATNLATGSALLWTSVSGDGYGGITLDNQHTITVEDGDLSQMPASSTGIVPGVLLSSTATGGQFTISWGGHTSSNLNYNQSASTIQTSITSLITAAGYSGAAYCAGGALSTTTAVLVQLSQDPAQLLTVNSSGTTGGTVTVNSHFGYVKAQNVTYPQGNNTALLSVTAATYFSAILSQAVMANANSGAFTVYLPSAVNNANTYTVKKTDSSGNAVTVSAVSGQEIDGSSTSVISSQYLSMTFVSDGTNWNIVSSVTSAGGVGVSNTQTLSNKRITKRTVVVTQSATPSMDTDNMDIASITGLAQPITSMTTNLTGTPNDGDKLEVRITDNGTAQAITWGSSFESTTINLPTTTVSSMIVRIGLEWNASASKWDCIAVA